MQNLVVSFDPLCESSKFRAWEFGKGAHVETVDSQANEIDKGQSQDSVNFQKGLHFGFPISKGLKERVKKRKKAHGKPHEDSSSM